MSRIIVDSQKFSGAKLISPEVFPAIHLFRDPIKIALSSSFPGSEIRYTLDGTEPDENALLFEDSILLGKSAQFGP